MDAIALLDLSTSVICVYGMMWDNSRAALCMSCASWCIEETPSDFGCYGTGWLESLWFLVL